MFHLKPKPRPPRYVGPRDARPRRRLLGRRDRARLAAVHDLVELLQELDRVEVLVAAVLVRHPLALLAGVVQVQHRRDRVDPDAVGVVLAQPEQGVGDEEVADLVAAVVEDQGAPVGVRAAARVLVLVQRGAVEAREREVVAREVRRDPVEDHAEALLVQPVDELAEVVRRAVARRRREVAAHLVAPRAGERVRHHRQQLDVREAHVERVGGELVGQLEVGERAVALERVQPPRAEVDLVDGHRALERGRTCGASASHSVVGPLVHRLVDHRRGLRRHLGGERERVGLQPDLAVGREDLVLVVRAALDAGQEQLPDAGRAHRAHRVQPAVPEVEVADDRDGAGGRRPHAERGAANAVDLAHVGAEAGPQLLVAPLGEQVHVELADRRQEAVGVVDRDGPGLAVVDLQPVRERQLGALEHALEHAAGVDRRERDRLTALGDRPHARRRRPERPDHHAAVRGMRAEDVVRAGVLAPYEALEVGSGGKGHERSVPTPERWRV